MIALTEKNPENFAFAAFLVLSYLNPKNFVYQQKDNRDLYFMLTLISLAVNFGSE